MTGSPQSWRYSGKGPFSWAHDEKGLRVWSIRFPLGLTLRWVRRVRPAAKPVPAHRVGAASVPVVMAGSTVETDLAAALSRAEAVLEQVATVVLPPELMWLHKAACAALEHDDGPLFELDLESKP